MWGILNDAIVRKTMSFIKMIKDIIVRKTMSSIKDAIVKSRRPLRDQFREI
jgi:hypothetical protein